ncbi:RNA-binding protein 14a [Tachysurus vachellii]|uniref:RNA-binding protein 14a n=1 Tax=Tachysurus vachellii TaxID=175792 RepID=UPI00296B304A|nr:RNA-binding protein 14a [Tachysurus vachellii]
MPLLKSKPDSSAGYTFLHMEHQENAANAVEALYGTSYTDHHLSVDLSNIQQANPGAMSKVPCARCGTQGHFAGECPTRPPMEHHQSQAAVLAAAAAAAAGLPIQVQQCVHNSFFNTNTSDPTYAALKGLTEASGTDGKPVSAAVYGALASQVYGSVADQVISQGTDDSGYPAAGEAPSATTTTTAMNPAYGTNSSAYAGPAYGTMGGAEPDAQALFEAARQRFIEQGQHVLAEQQAITKSDRDRSPVRRSALLPDPVPQPISATRPKRRALLPTPPGGPELPAIKDGDPIARCYAEYVQQYQQYQQYQHYQHYQQYQYYYPPPPPPPPHQMPTMPMPPSGSMDGNHMAAPGTGASPRAMHLRLSSVFHSNAERLSGTRTNTNTHMHNMVSVTSIGLDTTNLL